MSEILYVGEPKRCENCGEYVFFNHHMWSNGRTTHGLGAEACRSAAEAIREMPLTFDIAIGALVQIGELLGGFICATEDDEYNDPRALQRLLHEAGFLAGEGIRAETIRRDAA